jgi:hypothetical protein
MTTVDIINNKILDSLIKLHKNLFVATFKSLLALNNPQITEDYHKRMMMIYIDNNEDIQKLYQKQHTTLYSPVEIINNYVRRGGQKRSKLSSHRTKKRRNQ